jgi:uncharacterized integral membrane protein
LYRIGFIIIIAAAIVLGLLIGALNSDTASIDLLWLQLEWPLGLVILSGIALGIMIGVCLAWFFSILPLRLALRKAQNTDQLSATGSLKNTHV